MRSHRRPVAEHKTFTNSGHWSDWPSSGSYLQRLLVCRGVNFDFCKERKQACKERKQALSFTPWYHSLSLPAALDCFWPCAARSLLSQPYKPLSRVFYMPSITCWEGLMLAFTKGTGVLPDLIFAKCPLSKLFACRHLWVLSSEARIQFSLSPCSRKQLIPSLREVPPEVL